jgi:hypothetical protein
MSPIAAMNVAAQITLTPGTVINRLISGDSRASVAISRSTASISRSRNSIWRIPASTVSRSSSGSGLARSRSGRIALLVQRGGRRFGPPQMARE